LKHCNYRGKEITTKKGLLCDCDFGFNGFLFQDCTCDKQCEHGTCQCEVDSKNNRTLTCKCDDTGDWIGE